MPPTQGDPPAPTALAVDGRESPIALPPDGNPRFRWRIDDRRWGSEQSAYRLLVARSRRELLDRALLWDSGRVSSANAADVAYDGPPLAADTRYWWTVRVWNDEGEASAWADPSSFATAPDGLAGEWLTRAGDPGDTNGYRSTWRPPEEVAEEWVQVDLGEPRRIASVELSPAEPFGGPTTPDGRTITAQDTEETYRESTTAQGPVAFGFPDRYRVEAADDADFDDPTIVSDYTAEDQPDPRREPVVHEAGVEARHVRIVATDLDAFAGGDGRLREEQRPWAVFALAGLAVRDADGNDLAHGAPVTASSSHESETWGSAHLTNGVQESRMGDDSPLFRREVTLSKPVECARAHVAGLGYGELYVNGEKAGDAVLDPGWTQYDERVLFATHDVTDQLSAGENALGLWLGRGWFGKPVRQWPGVGSPRGCLHLTVEYEDGTTRTIRSDGDWRTASSPIETNDIYDGERYDARRERDGWAQPGFDDVDWEPAAVVAGPDGDLVPQQTPPIRVTETLSPDAIHEHDDGPIVDFGQNAAGRVDLTVRGADPGREVTIRHAEALNDDGSLQTVDLRTAAATDTYVTCGGAVETYRPRFTYHGFRYAQIEGYPGEFAPEDVTAEVVHTDFADRGSFACANRELTRVHENARWGLRSNAHSVPTDCPQRDERQGFTGDGHLAAGALQYNFDAGRFHEKFLRDHVDAQSPHGYVPSKVPNGSEPGMSGVTWTYSFLALPWRRYRHDATDRALETHYEDLRRFVEFWHEVTDDDLLPEAYTAYGDWVALENADGRRGQPEELFTNAYLYRATDVLARAADVLGCDGDAARYRNLAGDVAVAFNERYFDADAGRYEPGTQAADAIPLSFGMVLEDRRDDVASSLAESVREAGDQLRTGFLGTPALLDALTRHGYADLAYEVATRSAFPGWVYMLRNGATTIWERWDTDERVGSRMNSRNHSPFTLISEWCYEAVAGLRVTEALPAKRRVYLVPGLIEDLDWAEAAVETPHGEVATRWDRADGDFAVRVSVPWNLEAAVDLAAEETTIRVDGDPVWKEGRSLDDSGATRGVSASERGVQVLVGPGDHEVVLE